MNRIAVDLQDTAQHKVIVKTMELNSLPYREESVKEMRVMPGHIMVLTA
jgi:hypothetical protein